MKFMAVPPAPGYPLRRGRTIRKMFADEMADMVETENAP